MIEPSIQQAKRRHDSFVELALGSPVRRDTTIRCRVVSLKLRSATTLNTVKNQAKDLPLAVGEAKEE